MKTIALATTLLARMAALNPALHSYTATMHAHVVLTTFPFLSTEIVATYYHKDPDLDKLRIQSGLPLVAQGFSVIYPHIEPPSRWASLYTIDQTADDGSTTALTLTPRTPGNVRQIDVTVNDATATIRSMRWEYENGGTAQLEDHYSVVQGNTLVTSQTGRVDEPNYKGDITATLSDYRVNPDLPDALFSQ
ncbi:MAG TPA: hypothetical protein VMD47_05515 [Candidatus Acidoferrales bacterium]|nr:hypothetical protein [Candidatus Acidoferrales bacterium]